MKKALTLSQKIELGIAKIFFLANQINRKTDICVFTTDTAHCSYIELRIVRSKSEYDKDPIIFSVHYTNEFSKFNGEDTLERLKEIEKCITALEDILKDKKIDYSLFYAVREYIITSYQI
jgi:hypothetical protein